MTKQFSTLITARQLEDILDQPALRIFDCRFNLLDENQGIERFKQGHIIKSQYADLNKQLAGPVLKHTGRHPLPDKRAFEDQLRKWGIDESSQIVVYDDAFGAIAARLWWLCKWAGIDRVAVLDGGLNEWIANHNELSKEIVSFKKTKFQARYDDRLWVSTETVETLKNDSNTLITDARATKRFNGETEPIDTRAGHIPGAVNLPFESNLSAEGRFLSNQELLGLHQQATEISKVISMCGSGVTACHNILARVHAGLDSGQLYVGSWSEWITDANHEIDSTVDDGSG